MGDDLLTVTSKFFLQGHRDDLLVTCANFYIKEEIYNNIKDFSSFQFSKGPHQKK